MRKILFFICSFFFVAAVAQNRYSIVGEIVDCAENGDTLYLMSNMTDSPKVESMAIIKEGGFHFAGTVSEPQFANIVTFSNNKIERRAELFIEKGVVSVKIGEQRQTADGTFLNNRLQQYKDSILPFNLIFEKYASKVARKDITPAALEEAQKVMLITSVARAEFAEKYLRKNKDNLVALYILRNNYELFSPAKGLELLSLLPLYMQEEPTAAKIKEYYKGVLQAAEGASFIDTRLSDPQGNIRSLSDYIAKGKILILNFWSSTNSASLKEQRMLALYEQKNSNRVTVIGLSLDTNISEWLKSIKENSLSSVQLTDAKGWSSAPLRLYGVNSNPYCIVIDADGTILKRCSTASDALNLVNAVLNK